MKTAQRYTQPISLWNQGSFFKFKIYISGAYKNVNYEDPTSEHYCPGFPFTWAFTTLIVYWILMPTIAIGMCVFAILKDRKEKSVNENQQKI